MFVIAVNWSGHFYCGKLTLNVCITFLQCFVTAAAAAVQAADGMAVVVDQAVSEYYVKVSLSFCQSLF